MRPFKSIIKIDRHRLLLLSCLPVWLYFEADVVRLRHFLVLHHPHEGGGAGRFAPRATHPLRENQPK